MNQGIAIYQACAVLFFRKLSTYQLVSMCFQIDALIKCILFLFLFIKVATELRVV